MKVENNVTVKEVRALINTLRVALGLVEEEQESSLRTFVKDFNKMDLVKASMIVQHVIYNENYIEDSAQERLKMIMPQFPYRTEEDVKEKLMKIQSILVAVALILLVKSKRKEYIMWLFEDAQEFIENNHISNGIQRLEVILGYLGSD